MLRKRKEPKGKRRCCDDVKGSAAETLTLFGKLRAAGGFSDEHPTDLAKAEKMLRDFAGWR